MKEEVTIRLTKDEYSELKNFLNSLQSYLEEAYLLTRDWREYEEGVQNIQSDWDINFENLKDINNKLSI